MVSLMVVPGHLLRGNVYLLLLEGGLLIPPAVTRVLCVLPMASTQPYLYLIRVESLAKEEAALEISVSTIGFTTCDIYIYIVAIVYRCSLIAYFRLFMFYTT